MSLYNNIFDAHAHYDDKWFDDDRFELLENIHTKGVCGIVNNAVDLEMPLIVHDREAHGDVYDLLRKYKPNALVHCFSGSVELMREAVRMGMYISLGGVVTFKNARHSLEVASEIPLDRLLLETDAPYMAPVPFRGKRCDSSMIIYAAEKIASLRNISISELLQITCDNAKQFYNIDD